MAAPSVTCHACGAARSFDGPVPRLAECDDCGVHLHCCRNCRFYDTSAYNDCRESSAERVVDKSASNFCDYFSPGKPGESGESAVSGSARDDLDRLFGKK